MPVDLTSEYPSVDALLGIWDVLTAQRLTTEDATKDVRALLAKVTLDGAFQPAFWKQLNFYALVIPEGDILPVRSVYDSKSGTCNIGLNTLHWKHSMWVAGPDLTALIDLYVLKRGQQPSVGSPQSTQIPHHPVLPEKCALLRCPYRVERIRYQIVAESSYLPARIDRKPGALVAAQRSQVSDLLVFP